MANDGFVVLYMHNAHHQLELFDWNGKSSGQIRLPKLGSIHTEGYFLNLTCERGGNELFYTFCSFLHPPSVYRFDFTKNASELVYSPSMDLSPRSYITEQVFATSKDGTRIPMFLSHKKGIGFDGDNPTLLFGYGGLGVSLVPRFDVSFLAFMEMGGVLAWANLRGGGEFGEEWHKAGMLENKQNVFDDFIACAEHLIKERITSAPKLAITGGSNGGLLVGACMTQRPELFGASVPRAGLFDMLRFQGFTVAWASVSEFGSSADPYQFEVLYKYSPLHNIKPNTTYPATLVITSDHDDRVVPLHSFKFAAALQAAQAGDNPILLRVQTRAGHGMGKSTKLEIEEGTDILAFLAKALDFRAD